jgi:hypothetical protein
VIKEVGIKTLYCSEGIEGSEWVGIGNSSKKQNFLTCRSGLSLSDEKPKHDPRSLCYFANDSNWPQQNQIVYFSPLPPYSNNRCIPVIEGGGWRRAIALYSARKLSKDTWVTHKDQYLVPSIYEEGVDK